MSINKETQLIPENLGYALCLHFKPVTDFDQIFKDLINSFFDKYKCNWYAGGEWISDKPIQKTDFEKYYAIALDEYSKYRNGLQTRTIGTLIIDELSSLIFFRKLQDGWTIGFYSSEKTKIKNVLEANIHWIEQKEFLSNLIKEFFQNISQKHFTKQYGPPTNIYVIEKFQGIIPTKDIEQNVLNQNSHLYSFLSDNICVKGIKPERLPRSIMNGKLFLLRNPSFYYSNQLDEKFLLLPTNKDSNLSDRLIIIDLVASAEHYHTKFYALLNSVGPILDKIDRSTPFLFKMLEALNKSPKNIYNLHKRFIRITKKYRKLIKNYTAISLYQEELDHTHNSANHLLSTLSKNTFYGSNKETRVNQDIEGALESILSEFEQRHLKSLKITSATISRSYTSFTALSNQISSAYQISLSLIMNKYTNQIRFLTFFLIIIGLITISPYFKDIINFFSNLLK